MSHGLAGPRTRPGDRQGVDDVAQGRQRLVDLAGLLQTLSGSVGVLLTLAACSGDTNSNNHKS
jgi:hypothetical protein